MAISVTLSPGILYLTYRPRLPLVRTSARLPDFNLPETTFFFCLFFAKSVSILLTAFSSSSGSSFSGFAFDFGFDVSSGVQFCSLSNSAVSFRVSGIGIGSSITGSLYTSSSVSDTSKVCFSSGIISGASSFALGISATTFCLFLLTSTGVSFFIRFGPVSNFGSYSLGTRCTSASSITLSPVSLFSSSTASSGTVILMIAWSSFLDNSCSSSKTVSISGSFLKESKKSFGSTITWSLSAIMNISFTSSGCIDHVPEMSFS